MYPNEMNGGSVLAVIVCGTMAIVSGLMLPAMWVKVMRAVRFQDDRQAAGTIAAVVLWLAAPAVILAASLIGLSIELAALN